MPSVEFIDVGIGIGMVTEVASLQGGGVFFKVGVRSGSAAPAGGQVPLHGLDPHHAKP